MANEKNGERKNGEREKKQNPFSSTCIGHDVAVVGRADVQPFNITALVGMEAGMGPAPNPWCPFLPRLLDGTYHLPRKKKKKRQVGGLERGYIGEAWAS